MIPAFTTSSACRTPRWTSASARAELAVELGLHLTAIHGEATRLLIARLDIRREAGDERPRLTFVAAVYRDLEEATHRDRETDVCRATAEVERLTERYGFVPLAEQPVVIDEVCRHAGLPETVSAATGEGERLLRDRPHLLDAVEAVERDEDVVVRAERLAHEVGFESDGERLPQERLGLARPVEEDEALRVECACEHGGQAELLRDLECELDPLGGCGAIPGEEVQPSELGGQRRDVGIALVFGQHGERLLHELEALVRASTVVEHSTQSSCDSRSVVGRACLLAELERRAEMCLGHLDPIGGTCELACAFEEPCALERVVGKLDRALKRALCLFGSRRARLHVPLPARATHALVP